MSRNRRFWVAFSSGLVAAACRATPEPLLEPVGARTETTVVQHLAPERSASEPFSPQLVDLSPEVRARLAALQDGVNDLLAREGGGDDREPWWLKFSTDFLQATLPAAVELAKYLAERPGEAADRIQRLLDTGVRLIEVLLGGGGDRSGNVSIAFPETIEVRVKEGEETRRLHERVDVLVSALQDAVHTSQEARTEARSDAEEFRGELKNLHSVIAESEKSAQEREQQAGRDLDERLSNLGTTIENLSKRLDTHDSSGFGGGGTYVEPEAGDRRIRKRPATTWAFLDILLGVFLALGLGSIADRRWRRLRPSALSRLQDMLDRSVFALSIGFGIAWIATGWLLLSALSSGFPQVVTTHWPCGKGGYHTLSRIRVRRTLAWTGVSLLAGLSGGCAIVILDRLRG